MSFRYTFSPSLSLSLSLSLTHTYKHTHTHVSHTLNLPFFPSAKKTKKKLVKYVIQVLLRAYNFDPKFVSKK